MTESNAETTATTPGDVPDEIVRSIHIDADAQTVWDVVSEPGWFINDGEFRQHTVTVESAAANPADSSVSRVVDPEYGEFVIETVALDPPSRAVFRCLGGEPGEGSANNTVTFTIDPDPGGAGVTLTVRETGFATISDDAAARRRAFEENTKGWVEELDLARRLAESRGSRQ